MSTETRTTSSTGGEKGVKAERHDLLPRPGLDAIARVFGFGASKYADHNWRKGYEWGKSYAALQRHLLAFWSGETHDPESGLPHLAHAGFHVLVLLTWLEEQGEGGQFDDRYRPEPETSDAWVDQILGGPEHGVRSVANLEDFDEAHEWSTRDLQPLIDMHDRAVRELVDRQFVPQFSISTDGTVTSLFEDPMAKAREYMEERADEFAAALAKVVDEQPTMPEFPRVTLDKFVRVHPIDPDSPHTWPVVGWMTEAAAADIGRNRG